MCSRVCFVFERREGVSRSPSTADPLKGSIRVPLRASFKGSIEF